MKSKILILSLWTPLPNDPRTSRCKLWITWGLDVGPMSKGLMVLLLKVVGLNCAINLVINVSSLPLDCWKLVTMGMESQCRWCVMECGPSGHRFCVCVCVSLWHTWPFLFPVFSTQMFFCLKQKGRKDWFGSFGTSQLSAWLKNVWEREREDERERGRDRGRWLLLHALPSVRS